MKSPSRLYLIDLVRTYSFVAILMFHFYSAVYFVEWSNDVVHGYLFDLMTWLPRSASFSGFTILGLFCLLAGWKDSRITWRPLLGLFLIGSALLLLTQGEQPFQEMFWEWDIYHFLMATLVSLLLFQGRRRLALGMGLLGFIMTLIPFWKWPLAETMPLAKHALIGICDDEGRGGWPLLPWIGFSWAAYAYGLFLREKPMTSRKELAVWIPALLLSLFMWGPYYRTPVGPGFSCFVFRQDFWIFWAHLIWIIFFARFATYQNLNEWLAKKPFVVAISNLRINRHFGRAYFIHLFFLALATLAAEDLRASPILYDVFWICILPLTELLLRMLEQIDRKLNSKA